MNKDAQLKLLEVLNQEAQPLDQHSDFSSLLEQVGEARFVMIGEASHGTQEFYQTRIAITQQLIQQKGFMAVAIEGDWPDAHRIHKYIRGRNDDNSTTALSNFQRFPSWMWRNTTMPPFLKWLRDYNQSTMTKVGFYGLDLYSLGASMQAVIKYLNRVDPLLAEQATRRYECFDHVAIDPQMYGYMASQKIKKSCISEAVEMLNELQRHAFEFVQNENHYAEDDYFFAEQNARLVKNAEKYYRSMFTGHVESWNIRDHHMAEILNEITRHLKQLYNKPAKIIIWAHNSHLGDARATEMGERGEVNLGQLVREQHPDSYSIGFSTYQGYVTAATNWDEDSERKKINPGLQGSYEELFHGVNYKDFIIHLKNNDKLEHYLKIPRLQRAIGVIYRPETERFSHYFLRNFLINSTA